MYSIQLYVQYFGKNTVNTVILDVVQLTHYYRETELEVIKLFFVQ